MPHRRIRLAAVGAVGLLLLSGCLHAAPASSIQEAPKDLGAQDVVSAVQADPALKELLPAEIRQSGVLTVGSAVGTPPIAFHPQDGGPPRGVDIDVADAVARKLGLTVKRDQVSGASLLTGLTAGRFAVGTANFSVTEERKKVLDFTTYLTDGTGILVRDDSSLTEVTDLAQLCGSSIGTGVGSTFENDLRRQQDKCVQAGKQPYRVSTYSDAAAHFLALREGHVDVLVSSASVLRYAAAQQPGLRLAGQLDRRDVGLATNKGAGLAEPLRAAIDALVAEGAYQKILAKWHLEEAGIQRSAVNPSAA
ncbi:ABC transporter substrate-binding protein [Micromonospora lupini]|uniref:Extracellular ABC transporter substrate-binding protein n=1 Tax=Micromonospora lupini str. Lupac 08 TaxID=1150864 RepID=I0L7F4_9ACTN|nr:ABC transporter substrate-binding protein [Micromonospora lupini]CCH19751.1 Extracellular ABC transporter substrate-binding protein [Micromonospora lupini str. Lupac 08]